MKSRSLIALLWLAATAGLAGCGSADTPDSGLTNIEPMEPARLARVQQLAEGWDGEIDFTSAYSPSGVQATQPEENADAGPQFDPNDPFFGLPRTEGYILVHATCIACHETRLLMAQRQTEHQWQGVVDLMIKKHGMVPPPPEQRRQIVEYLTRHFSP